MIEYIGIRAPSTRRILETILGVEEEHAEELSSMLKGVHASSRGAIGLQPRMTST